MVATNEPVTRSDRRMDGYLFGQMNRMNPGASAEARAPRQLKAPLAGPFLRLRQACGLHGLTHLPVGLIHELAVLCSFGPLSSEASAAHEVLVLFGVVNLLEHG